MSSTSILEPGHNCWRVERSPRLAFLIDGERYFHAFRETVKRARRSVLILGWDVDSRTPLLRRPTDDGLPTELYAFLKAMTAKQPQLEVYVLTWDFSMIYALEREWLPLYKLDWKRDRRLHFHMDDAHPLGASQHQKVVVVDDAVAFCGGLDLTKNRWDTTQHRAHDPLRVDPDGHPYGPFHDSQMMVSGSAARALGELVRWRWRRATRKRIASQIAEPSAEALVQDLWPETVTVDAQNVDVGIARTFPPYRDVDAVREVEQLFVDAIQAARRYIYIENQYLSSKKVGDALEARLAESDGPEVVVVMPRKASGWIEQTTMDVVRARLMRKLVAADEHGKLGIYYPVAGEFEGRDADKTQSDGGGEAQAEQGADPSAQTAVVAQARSGTAAEPTTETIIETAAEDETVSESAPEVYVHSKLMIVDDRFVRIGSANLSNRSMGMDSECDLAVEMPEKKDTHTDVTAGSRLSAVIDLRNRLLGEHLRMEAEQVNAAIERQGSVGRAVARLARRGALRELDWEVDERLDREVPQTAIIDPERPISPQRLIALFVPPEAQQSTYGRMWKFLLLLLALAGLTVAWRWSPLHEVVNVTALTGWLDRLGAVPGAEALVVAGFTIGAVIGIPVTVLIAAVAMAYEPLIAFVLSFCGTMLAATASFWLGHLLGRSTVRRLAGSRLNQLSRKLARRGVLAVATVRVVPVAPYALLNVVAGASHVRFMDYFWGTLLGMTPGLLAMSFFVGNLLDAVRDPTPTKVAVVLAVFVIILVGVFFFSRYLGGRKPPTPKQPPPPAARQQGAGERKEDMAGGAHA